MKKITTKLFSILYMASIVSVSCKARISDQQTTVKVINGIPAKAGEFPSIAKLTLYHENSTSLCTGTFLNQSVFLTAAHCVADSGKVYRASVSEIDVIDTWIPKEFLAAKSKSYGFPSEGFNQYVRSDMALLKFPANTASRLGITRFMSLAHDLLFTDNEVVIVGFGRVKAAVTSPGILHWGKSNITSSDKDVVVVNGGNVAKKGENSLASAGDSGGPLLLGSSPNIAQTIIGVFSKGTGVLSEVPGASYYASTQSAIANKLFKSAINDGYESFTY